MVLANLEEKTKAFSPTTESLSGRKVLTGVWQRPAGGGVQEIGHGLRHPAQRLPLAENPQVKTRSRLRRRSNYGGISECFLVFGKSTPFLVCPCPLANHQAKDIDLVIRRKSMEELFEGRENGEITGDEGAHEKSSPARLRSDCSVSTSASPAPTRYAADHH